jgi:hypothetical protein
MLKAATVRMFPASRAGTRHHFTMGCIASADWLIQNNASRRKKTRLWPGRKVCAGPQGKHNVMPSVRKYTECQDNENGEDMDGWTAGRGYHRRDERHRAAHRGDFVAEGADRRRTPAPEAGGIGAVCVFR